jgi:PhnB protein
MQIQIGNSRIMLSEPCEDSPMPSPDTLGGSTFSVHLYVDDVDAMFEQAIDAGALDIRSVEDQFYGDRMGTLKDPFGHIWFVSTHLEDLTQEEIQERSEAVFST